MLVLVINCGSSSVKYDLFDMPAEKSLAGGLADRIGMRRAGAATISMRCGDREEVLEAKVRDHREAIGEILKLLTREGNGVVESLEEIQAVGHRVVHGGEEFTDSALVDDEVTKAISRCAELAPLHNPPNLEGIRAGMELLPWARQVAVFDTAFPGSMPRRAYLYGLPLELAEKHGIRRYGFHGTSHRYVYETAMGFLGEDEHPEDTRAITCHLGNGCSMCAIKEGKVEETSMGFTPLEGLLMGTRSGDLDPAVVCFLQDREGMTAEEVNELLNKKSGLLGISGRSNDMRDLLSAMDAGDERARDAVEVFCHRVRKYIGAYYAVLNGRDVLIFTAGIGENSAAVRRMVCSGLSSLGIELDEELNERGSGIREISAAGARAKVLVVPGSENAIKEESQALKLASKIGYPVIIKAVAGGGGRGMRVVHNDISLRSALAAAKAEAKAAFGDASVYLEKFIVEPRHVEVQVIADKAGNALHFYERDCSIQRRHQKMIEESPCSVLD